MDAYPVNRVEKSENISQREERQMQGDRISFDSFCAIFRSSYLSISESEDLAAVEKQLEGLIEKKNSQDTLLRKELLGNLSEEAKFVVKMLVFSSEEFLDSLSPPNYKRPTRFKLRQHLIEKGWQHKVIDAVFDELKGYCRELNFLT